MDLLPEAAEPPPVPARRLGGLQRQGAAGRVADRIDPVLARRPRPGQQRIDNLQNFSQGRPVFAGKAARPLRCGASGPGGGTGPAVGAPCGQARKYFLMKIKKGLAK